MKKTISLKLFCTVVWRSFRQVMRRVARLFGYEASDRYMKNIWKVTVGCMCTVITIFSLMFLYVFVDEIVMDEWYRVARRVACIGTPSEEWNLSNHIAFQRFGKKTRVVNEVTGEVTIRNVDNIVTSSDGDSLAVFFKDGKRGFLNRYTGEIAIPAKYSKAWVFSQGLAAVVEEGELKFIDHKGRTVISKGFQPSVRDDRYIFEEGYCFIRDKVSGMLGAIDTAGNWVIQPSFSSADYIGKYIVVRKALADGLYTKDLQEVLPLEYSDISIHLGCKTILTRKGIDGPKLYDLDMNLLSDFVVDDSRNVVYYTGEERTFIDDDGDEVTEKVYKVANSKVYRVSTPGTRDTYGLMSKQGKLLTPPIYDGITAIASDRYLCSPHGVVLDDSGREVF